MAKGSGNCERSPIALESSQVIASGLPNTIGEGQKSPAKPSIYRVTKEAKEAAIEQMLDNDQLRLEFGFSHEEYYTLLENFMDLGPNRYQRIGPKKGAEIVRAYIKLHPRKKPMKADAIKNALGNTLPGSKGILFPNDAIFAAVEDKRHEIMTPEEVSGKKFNKGEWSELLVALHLARQGTYNGEPIQRIRQGGNVVYTNNGGIWTVTIENEEYKQFTEEGLERITGNLYRAIVAGASSSFTLDVAEIEDLLQSAFKQGGKYKGDVLINTTNKRIELPIKSFLGGNPSLHNPAQKNNTTLYLPDDMQVDIDSINLHRLALKEANANKWKKPYFDMLIAQGIKPVGFDHDEEFHQRLIAVDEAFPQQWADLVTNRHYYGHTSVSNMSKPLQAAGHDLDHVEENFAKYCHHCISDTDQPALALYQNGDSFSTEQLDLQQGHYRVIVDHPNGAGKNNLFTLQQEEGRTMMRLNCSLRVERQKV